MAETATVNEVSTGYSKAQQVGKVKAKKLPSSRPLKLNQVIKKAPPIRAVKTPRPPKVPAPLVIFGLLVSPRHMILRTRLAALQKVQKKQSGELRSFPWASGTVVKEV